MDTFNSLIHKALEIGDITEISTLLNRPDLNLEAFDSEGETVLHQIIKNEQLSEEKIIDTLKIFLYHGIDLNIRNKYGISILDLAIERRLRYVIDLLLKYTRTIIIPYFIRSEYEKFWKMAGADDNSILSRREIMEKESASYVEWLILKGIDFNSETTSIKKGRNDEIILTENSILISAVRYNLLHILPVLLKYTVVGNNDLRDGQKLLHDIFLIKNDNSVIAADENGLTPLRAAIEREEDLSNVQILINYFPDSCDKNSLAMNLFYEMVIVHWSTSKVDVYRKILDDFIAEGVEINGKIESGNRLIQCAIKAKHLITVTYLKDKAVNFHMLTDNNGDNLLHILAQTTLNKNYSDKIKDILFDFLVKEGCQVNGSNKIGNSPLHTAAKYVNLTIARKLIAYGALVDYRNSEMQTPLHLATEHEHAVKIVEFLIGESAKVNCRDVHGGTPLHYAASSFYKSSVKVQEILLQNGAYLNAQNNKGDSPLAQALFAYNRDNFQELLEYGANINNSSIFTCIADDFGDFEFRGVCEHWQKLTAAGLPCLEDYKEVFGFSKSINTEFYEKCLKEVETLKGTSIDSHTSLHDFLHMNSDRRYIYVHNEKLKNIVDCLEIMIRFPNYYVLILGSYREAVARKALIKSAKEGWLTLTEISLPEICIERIFYYLNDLDLMIIIDEK